MYVYIEWALLVMGTKKMAVNSTQITITIKRAQIIMMIIENKKVNTSCRNLKIINDHNKNQIKKMRK